MSHPTPQESTSSTDRPRARSWRYRALSIARGYSIASICFIWGVATVRFEVFPYQLIDQPLTELTEWVRGPAEGRQLTLLEKLRSELEADVPYQGTALIGENLGDALQPVRDPQDLLKGARVELSYMSRRTDGYYLFFMNPFAQDALFGAVIISADGELKRLIKRPHIKKGRKILGQGGVTDEGLLIFNSYQHLYITDLCGREVMKRTRGGGQYFGQGRGKGFHHKASGADGVIWAWYSNELRLYRLSDGKWLKRHTLLDLIKANRDVPIFESRLIKSKMPKKLGQWRYKHLNSKKVKLSDISLYDPFHQNDVDVLSRNLAPKFPLFEPGDLLLSFRSLNLITVIDPKTLKVKWHHSGDFSRQHDPDWGEDGSIILYDNRSHQGSSRVISIHPETREVKVLVDGERWQFYQYAQGNQHVDAEGRVLFTNQSEAVQLNGDQIDFYFQYRSRKGKPLDVGTVRFIDAETYRAWSSNCELP